MGTCPISLHGAQAVGQSVAAAIILVDNLVFPVRGPVNPNAAVTCAELSILSPWACAISAHSAHSSTVRHDYAGKDCSRTLRQQTGRLADWYIGVDICQALTVCSSCTLWGADIDVNPSSRVLDPIRSLSDRCWTGAAVSIQSTQSTVSKYLHAS